MITRDGKSVVFAIEDNKVRSLPITTGADLHGQIIVKQGLAGSAKRSSTIRRRS